MSKLLPVSSKIYCARKMKFVVDNLTKCVPRIGKIEQNSGDGTSMTIDTPFPMLYTKGGSIPHITYEVFKLVCDKPQCIQIPLASTYHFQEAMADFHGTIADFVGLSECMTCLVVQDPGDLTQTGHHYKDMIPLWTRQGKVLLNCETYMKVVNTFNPDMYCLLSDCDTNVSSSKKRVSKAVDNTVELFKQCNDKFNDLKQHQSSFAIASITGGYSIDQRKRCLEEMLQINNDIAGFSIDGLHNNGPETEFIKFAEIKAVVEYVLQNTPAGKLRAVYGCWNPVTLLHLVEMGIDAFDTSYCHIVTERSSALTFSFEEDTITEKYEINLREPSFAEDFEPLLPGCACLTCRKHTRSYIHHLISVQELLGPLLLTIHNIHHYMQFFEKIHKCIRLNSLSSLREVVSDQFTQYQNETTKKQFKKIN